MARREQELVATLIDLADTLVSDYDLVDYLDRLIERSLGVLGGAAGGVLLANADGQLELLAASDQTVRTVELLQVDARQGPCVEAFNRNAQVVEPDLTSSQRWPEFADTAAQAGYGAVLAFPLHLRDQVIGALNIFRRQAGDVAELDRRAAQAFADMATIGILQQRAVRESATLAGQLQTALNSRVVIEQAKGVIAERTGLDMGGAWNLLRNAARRGNLRLREVAAGVVSGGLAIEELQPPTV